MFNFVCDNLLKEEKLYWFTNICLAIILLMITISVVAFVIQNEKVITMNQKLISISKKLLVMLDKATTSPFAKKEPKYSKFFAYLGYLILNLLALLSFLMCLNMAVMVLLGILSTFEDYQPIKIAGLLVLYLCIFILIIVSMMFKCSADTTLYEYQQRVKKSKNEPSTNHSSKSGLDKTL